MREGGGAANTNHVTVLFHLQLCGFLCTNISRNGYQKVNLSRPERKDVLAGFMTINSNDSSITRKDVRLVRQMKRNIEDVL